MKRLLCLYSISTVGLIAGVVRYFVRIASKHGERLALVIRLRITPTFRASASNVPHFVHVFKLDPATAIQDGNSCPDPLRFDSAVRIMQ